MHDATGGPEQDGESKALRRHWYSWFKVHLAQPLSKWYEEDPNSARWGLNWAARMSKVYATLVDRDGVTYEDLWVKDASRMMQRLEEELFRNANILICVEKDSLFEDFVAPAKALGARAVLSGKGKNSKAAMELLLRKHFGWPTRTNFDTADWVEEPVFTADNPLYILTVSDWDYDGHAVIAPTFGEQARRYTEHVYEARVGITPQNVQAKGYSLQDTMYEVKVKDQGYIYWAEQNAMFVRTCDACGRSVLVQGAHDEYCTACGSMDLAQAVVAKQHGDAAHGFEVEAMRVRDYRDLIVQALLRIMDFEHIVQRLRIETLASDWEATETVQRNVCADNESYQRLMEEFERLEAIKLEFESSIQNALLPVATAHAGDFWQQGDDPNTEQLTAHVVEADAWRGAWRPFSIAERTTLLVDFVSEDQQYQIEDFKAQLIEW